MLVHTDITQQARIDMAEIQAKCTRRWVSTKGEMTQSGISAQVQMYKILNDQDLKMNRPQTPVPPFPYITRQVTVINSVDHSSLSGTLTLPHGNNRYPAVVLIWGSGPQDRDQSMFGHKIFAVIADCLTRAGIAVLRMDKRGVGGSTSGKDSSPTTMDYAEDIKAGISFLNLQEEIDITKIGLIGHSEGGLIAAIVADSLDTKVAFTILLAGPGKDGAAIIKEQFVAMNKANGQNISEEIKNLQFEMIDAIQRDESDKTIDELIKRLLLTDFDVKNEDELSNDSKIQFDQKLNVASAVKDPWYRLFLQIDPKTYLRRVKCPVLILNGDLDCQVVRDNASHISAALVEGGNMNVQVEFFPELNHLFQKCKTGAISEYAEIEETINPSVLERITSWIHQIVHNK